jgi:hypothetical protein
MAHGVLAMLQPHAIAGMPCKLALEANHG